MWRRLNQKLVHVFYAPEEIEADRQRVLLLGDSYVHAAAVQIAETIGQRLEAGLGPAWDVVSMGGVGWGQTEELEALLTHGDALDPDQVLHHGWLWAPGAAMRWGTNRVANLDIDPTEDPTGRGVHQRVPVFLGSKDDVAEMRSYYDGLIKKYLPEKMRF